MRSFSNAKRAQRTSVMVNILKLWHWIRPCARHVSILQSKQRNLSVPISKMCFNTAEGGTPLKIRIKSLINLEFLFKTLYNSF